MRGQAARSCLTSFMADLSQLHRLQRFVGYPAVPKSKNPVKIGVLGASQVRRDPLFESALEFTCLLLTRWMLLTDPQVANYALLWPSKRVADVEVVGVAAREQRRAEQFARTRRW